MSKQEISEVILSCAGKLGRTPSIFEVMKMTPLTRRQIRAHFGSFTHALRECNLEREITSGQKVPLEKLFVDWAGVVRKTGKAPSMSEYEAMSKYSCKPLVRCFGRWRQVVFGLTQFAEGRGLAEEWKAELAMAAEKPGDADAQWLIQREQAAMSPTLPGTWGNSTPGKWSDTVPRTWDSVPPGPWGNAIPGAWCNTVPGTAAMAGALNNPARGTWVSAVPEAWSNAVPVSQRGVLPTAEAEMLSAAGAETLPSETLATGTLPAEILPIETLRTETLPTMGQSTVLPDGPSMVPPAGPSMVPPAGANVRSSKRRSPTAGPTAGQTYGPPMWPGPLAYSPTNELGVVFLFGWMAQALGFVVHKLQPEFPDCEAMRRVAQDLWQYVRIEFEFESRNFLKHMHDAKQCDLIICWRHNWAECPVEVVELSSLLPKMFGR